jgi:hypothetical protein
MQTLTKQKAKAKKKKKPPTGMYKNGHNWLMHKLRHLGTESNTL